jgi:hypothetical protein
MLLSSHYSYTRTVGLTSIKLYIGGPCTNLCKSVMNNQSELYMYISQFAGPVVFQLEQD